MKDIQDRIIAGAVVVSTLALGLVLLSAIGDFKMEGKRRALTIDFARVDNIKPNVTQIKLAGLPIGLVTEVRILNPEERRELQKAAIARDPAATNAAPATIRIKGAVDAGVEISSKTAASIRQASMMSEHFIELSAGPPDSEPLPEDAIIAGDSGKGLNDLMDPAAALLANLRDSTSNVKTITSGLTDKIPAIIAKLDAILANAKTLSSEVSTEEARARIRKTLENIEAATDGLKSLSGDIKSVAEDAKVVSENLKVVSTHAKLMTATLAQRPWRVIFGGKPNDLPSEERIISSKKPLPVKPAEDSR